MRKYFILTLLFGSILLGALQVSGQEGGSAAQTAEALRAQLRDVEAKQAEMQSRLNQLDEDLKPENIERYFAGVGSTHPEELREHRRRQLQLEKNTLVSQLQSLSESKSRLESAISRADSLAYQQSALGSASLIVTRTWDGHKGLVLTGAVMLLAVVGVFSAAMITRWKRSRAS